MSIHDDVNFVHVDLLASYDAIAQAFDVLGHRGGCGKREDEECVGRGGEEKGLKGDAQGNGQFHGEARFNHVFLPALHMGQTESCFGCSSQAQSAGESVMSVTHTANLAKGAAILVLLLGIWFRLIKRPLVTLFSKF